MLLFISGAKVVLVLKQKQGQVFQVLPKNLHPCDRLIQDTGVQWSERYHFHPHHPCGYPYPFETPLKGYYL